MNPDYRLYHPKWHRERTPIFWWLGKFSYMKFITRELTSLAVGYAAVLLIVLIASLAGGEKEYADFLALLASPLMLAFHAIVILFLLIHTITWLNLAPKAIVVRMGRTRVPDSAILTGHYFAWIVASAIVAWLLVGR